MVEGIAFATNIQLRLGYSNACRRPKIVKLHLIQDPETMLHELRMDLGIPEPHLRFKCILKLISRGFGQAQSRSSFENFVGFESFRSRLALELEESDILHTRNEGELERGMLA